MKMVLFKYIVVVVVVMVSVCHSKESDFGRFRRDTDSNLQRIIDILTKQDQKINRLHTMIVTNQFLPRCVASIKSEDLVIAGTCWKDMINEVKTSDSTATTEIKLFGQLVKDAYDGEKDRIGKVIEFIKGTADKGSELAYGGYETLLKAMDHYDHYRMKKITMDNGLGSGMTLNTYRTLIAIREAEGEKSKVYTQLVPSVVSNVLSGTEVFIQNSVTKEFKYLPSGEPNTKILVGGGNNRNDSRYIWKVKPAQYRWDEYGQELFYIENGSTGDSLLSVASGDGSLKMAEADEERLKSTWAMFYIRLIEGSSGQEVAIQCSYWGIKTLTLEGDKKMPKLRSSKTLEEIPTGIWLLKPKEA